MRVAVLGSKGKVGATMVQAVQAAEAILKQSQAPTVLLSVADIYALAGEDAKVEPLV